MSSLRLNDEDMEEEYLGEEGQDSEEYSEAKAPKGHHKPGRPRSKGRPKKTGRGPARKISEDEESWEDRVKVRQKPTPSKQEPVIEGYIRIIDYLKKIDYDESSMLNKMNPYNALTAASFWYAISAEYFSHDFFSNRHQNDSAGAILERIHRLPLTIPQRILRIQNEMTLIEFETRELAELGEKVGEKINMMIPSPMPQYSPPIEKRLNISTVAEDDEFICSTRALAYNYIVGKMKKSDKWGTILEEYGEEVQKLPSKEMQRAEQVNLDEEQAEEQEANLFQLLRQQAKKKVFKKDKKEKIKSEDPNEIFDSEEGKQAEDSKMEDKIKEQLKEELKRVQQRAGMDQSQKEEQKMKQEVYPQKIEQEQREVTFRKEYDHQDALLDGILHMPLDKIISILQSSLPSIELPAPEKDLMPLPTKDPLEFVFQLHPEEERYLEYLKEHKKKRYRQKLASIVEQPETEKEEQFEDAKCQICTDGDYTDDNLIVFCNMCNISLHQRCIGLTKVPSQSWVCDVCAAFGPAGINLPCPLCNIRGGAMKRTNIHIDTNLFKDTNPGYSEYARRCPFNKNRQEYMPRQIREDQIQNEAEQGVRVVRNRGDKQQDCYYDYFVRSTYPTQQPVCHYVWVHYVCSIWVPECYFEEKNSVISVKGVETIDKKRFRHECFVCKKSRGGAAVKCEDIECNKYYHPECARKKKVYMEQLNLQKLKYLIFCQEHQPLKITRQIQYRKKKNREEIVKFARMIEKYIETYRIAQFPYRLMKNSHSAGHMQVFKADRHQPKHARHQSGASDQQFLKNLILKLKKAKVMTVHLNKIETGYQISTIETPSKRQIRKCLNRYDDFWASLTNGETNQDNFRRYERIMQENFQLKNKLETFLNGTQNQKPKGEEKKEKRKKRGKHVTQEMGIEEEGGIFCICRKPYQGETDMIECEICNEWYHFGCLGFVGEEKDAQGIQFKCMKCMKYEDEDQKQERLRKYKHLFREDSVLYNFRPPTPELMSQEEVDNKNYNQIMEELERSKHRFIGGKKASSKEEAARKKAQKKAEAEKNKSLAEKSGEEGGDAQLEEVPMHQEERGSEQAVMRSENEEFSEKPNIQDEDRDERQQKKEPSQGEHEDIAEIEVDVKHENTGRAEDKAESQLQEQKRQQEHSVNKINLFSQQPQIQHQQQQPEVE